MAFIVSVRVLKDFRVKLTFKNGVKKTVNLEPLLGGPIFGPLRDEKRFSEVIAHPDFGCLEWPNGADICPDVLYRGYVSKWVDTVPPETRLKVDRLYGYLKKASGKRRKSILRRMAAVLGLRRVPGEVIQTSAAQTSAFRPGRMSIMPKRIRCKQMYQVKVKSKKTGKWESRMWGCSRESIYMAAEIYREKFNLKARVEKFRKQAKVVRA